MILNAKPMEVLTAGLLSGEFLVQADAARLLGELGRREAVGPLVTYVVECRHCSKTAGMEALALLGDRAACPALRRLAEWPNVPDDWFWFFHRGVRAAACVALLALGDEAGAPYLVELAGKRHDVFFAWFAPAILRLKGRMPAVSSLKARLTVEALMGNRPGSTRFTNPGTAAMIAEALGVLGTKEARKRLRELARHASRYVRGAAATGLLARGAARTDTLFVEELAENDPADFVKIKAALALSGAGKTGWADRVVALAVGIRDSFDLAVAMEAVGRAGKKRHIPAVRRRLWHPDPYVRQCALEALERMGGDASQARRMLKDPGPRVRLSAAKFLAAREGARA